MEILENKIKAAALWESLDPATPETKSLDIFIYRSHPPYHGFTFRGSSYPWSTTDQKQMIFLSYVSSEGQK